jgi:hypothetical protein
VRRFLFAFMASALYFREVFVVFLWPSSYSYICLNVYIYPVYIHEFYLNNLWRSKH